jgi:hypothetical protein
MVVAPLHVHQVPEPSKRYAQTGMPPGSEIYFSGESGIQTLCEVIFAAFKLGDLDSGLQTFKEWLPGPDSN